jgi:hypothetical protein
LEDEPAVSSPGWLPSAEDCPELADVRADHERVLAATTEAILEVGDLHSKRNAELEAIRAAHEQAFFRGTNADVPELTVTEDEIAQAGARADAARDALQAFVRQAVATVCEREPEIVSGLDDARAEAEAKRAKAQELLAEADAMEEAPWRLTQWLDRATGRSHLGHFPYEQIEVPPPPEALDMEAALAGGGITEVMVNA